MESYYSEKHGRSIQGKVKRQKAKGKMQKEKGKRKKAKGKMVKGEWHFELGR